MLDQFNLLVKITVLLLIGCMATDGLAQEVGLATGSDVQNGALAGKRYRVIVSTDIGGTDPDDFQSMVHLLVYADSLDIEGLISSPYGPGRKQRILDVIDCYEKDFINLKTYSETYPTPDALRAITKQGETAIAPYAGIRQPTEGSRWIVECARRDDPRPLHVLVWGGIEDLAQALQDAPDILPKLRVYYIGGPNKKWGPNAYQYIATHHAKLRIIEANATYRGWFTGGEQSSQWGNKEFVRQHITGHGALGDFFTAQLDTIKMGDTPSVGWLLNGTPDDPSQPGWGGQFVRAWERPYSVFHRLTTTDDRIEVFGILELVLPLGDAAPDKPEAQLVVENLSLIGHTPGDGTMRFRFCPKAATSYRFAIRSNVSALDQKRGGITAVAPAAGVAQKPSVRHAHWWTDDPAPELAEGEHRGAKSVSRWRQEFLRDFAERMDRCTTSNRSSASRLRVVVSTDFPPIGVVKEGNVPNDQKSDPDDMQSMVRFLLYANEFDIEALIASSGTFANKARKQNILDVIDQYGQVYENLKKRDPLYPTPGHLRAVTFEGRNGTWGKKGTENIGEGKDSEASDALIAIVDQPDPRPIFVSVWGDCSVVAQAIWKVQNTRGAAEFEAFLSKLRIHQIATQDGTINWLRDNFPNLFIIHSEKTYQGMFGSRDPISDLAWVDEHIRKSHGPLCDVYPREGIGCTGVCEGDSPSFLWLVSANRGLNNPDDPTQESWGGQFKKHGDKNHFIDGPGPSSIAKWRKEFQMEFAARADWCVSQ